MSPTASFLQTSRLLSACLFCKVGLFYIRTCIWGKKEKSARVFHQREGPRRVTAGRRSHVLLPGPLHPTGHQHPLFPVLSPSKPHHWSSGATLRDSRLPPALGPQRPPVHSVRAFLTFPRRSHEAQPVGRAGQEFVLRTPFLPLRER